MDTVLGLLGIVVYILAILALAAGVTWLVVKISPTRDEPKPPKPQPESSG
jgi:hypothetical protein